MKRFNLEKMHSLVMCFFTSIFLFSSCASAKDVGLPCASQVVGLELNSPFENSICLNAEVTAIDSSDFKYVFAFDAHDLSLSTLDILETFGDKKFTLVIDGMCAGKCSRLLMPLAKKIIFTEDSFSALTDNSVDSRVFSAREFIGPIAGRTTVNMSEVFNAQKAYVNTIRNEFIPDVEIIRRSAKNVTHLTWNSFVRQSLVTQVGKACLPVNEVAVILTPRYLTANFFDVKRGYALPSEERIIEQIRSNSTEKTIIIRSYEHVPFYGCPAPSTE